MLHEHYFTMKKFAYSFRRFSAITLQPLYMRPVCCNNVFIAVMQFDTYTRQEEEEGIKNEVLFPAHIL